jgi:hypothetical protein
LGSKIFIDLNKYEFSECMSRLQSELDDISLTRMLPSTKLLTTPTPSIDLTPTTTMLASDWDEKQVEHWLRDRKINPVIVKNVTPSNGKLLCQMSSMLNSAPEYFYKSISTSSPGELVVTTRDSALFAYELKLLFKN